MSQPVVSVIPSLKREFSMDNPSFEPPKKKRTRARLDHLTLEEKQERRKEKNRQAAQTARDRKKTMLEQCEAEIAFLKQQNAILKKENMYLKERSQIADGSIISRVTDSGVSDVQSTSESNFSSPHSNGNEMDCSTVSSGNAPNNIPSPAPTDLIDELLSDHIKCMESCLPTDCDSNSQSNPEALIGSAASLSLQKTSPSDGLRLPVNCVGWTSIQIMSMLMIAGIHHRFSEKISCCQKESSVLNQISSPSVNLYDYIVNTKCEYLRQAAQSIIANKNRDRQQRLIVWEFARKYLSDERNSLIRVHKHCFPHE